MAKQTEPKIAVIVPCYKVKNNVLSVLREIPDFIDQIVCVDDCCPEQSGAFIKKQFKDNRLTVITHPNNLGVGGAMKTGYIAAANAGSDIAVKLDGDGQMDPAFIPVFIDPILRGESDYVKGNRFFRIKDLKVMPKLRLFGNAVLSFMAKLSTGYWDLFDPTNGYTALHLANLDLLEIEKTSNGYLFETDLLFRLNIARCVVHEIPMPAHYGTEVSNLSPIKSIPYFLSGHIKNFGRRIFYSYFLRNFSVASFQILLGPLLFLGGAIFGGYHWFLSSQSGIPSTAGTVAIAAVMLFGGVQLLLAALTTDMNQIPKVPRSRPNLTVELTAKHPSETTPE